MPIRISSFLPKKYKKIKVEDQLKDLDKDQDGKYSLDEIKNEIPGAIKGIIGKEKIDGAILSLFDKDGDKQVSQEEIEQCLQENFGIAYSEVKDMNVSSLVDKIQDAVESKQEHQKLQSSIFEDKPHV